MNFSIINILYFLIRCLQVTGGTWYNWSDFPKSAKLSPFLCFWSVISRIFLFYAIYSSSTDYFYLLGTGTENILIVGGVVFLAACITVPICFLINSRSLSVTIKKIYFLQYEDKTVFGQGIFNIRLLAVCVAYLLVAFANLAYIVLSHNTTYIKVSLVLQGSYVLGGSFVIQCLFMVLCGLLIKPLEDCLTETSHKISSIKLTHDKEQVMCRLNGINEVSNTDTSMLSEPFGTCDSARIRKYMVPCVIRQLQHVERIIIQVTAIQQDLMQCFSGSIIMLMTAFITGLVMASFSMITSNEYLGLVPFLCLLDVCGIYMLCNTGQTFINK
ncbi:hypothetical protein SK128_007016, partial [Halocaridina rubra]